MTPDKPIGRAAFAGWMLWAVTAGVSAWFVAAAAGGQGLSWVAAAPAAWIAVLAGVCRLNHLARARWVAVFLVVPVVNAPVICWLAFKPGSRRVATPIRSEMRTRTQVRTATVPTASALKRIPTRLVP